MRDEDFLDNVRAAASELKAFDLQTFTDVDLTVGPDRGDGLREAELAAGAVMWAATTVVDNLFDDLKSMQVAGAETVADANDAAFFILDDLPERYRNRYNELFVRKFLVATVAVTGRLSAPEWIPLASLAEELALRILVQHAVAVVEMALDAPADSGWVSTFYDAAFEDIDHEFLYEPDMDGIEDQPELGPPGMAPMRFESWFVPFNPDRSAPPYATDEPPDPA
jgi:hypothetical protein